MSRFVITDIPVSQGFASVAIPAATLSFVQLPNIACDEIIFGMSANDIAIAASATPGSNLLPLKTSGTQAPSQAVIQTGGNASNLYIANQSANTAQTVSFLWKSYLKAS